VWSLSCYSIYVVLDILSKSATILWQSKILGSRFETVLSYKDKLRHLDVFQPAQKICLFHFKTRLGDRLSRLALFIVFLTHSKTMSSTRLRQLPSIAFPIYHSSITERRGRVVNTRASYSEIQGSNFGPESGYLYWGFSWFCSVPPGNVGILSYVRPRPPPSLTFPTHHSPLIVSFDTINLSHLQRR
jgi:hypothetical protein